VACAGGNSNPSASGSPQSTQEPTKTPNSALIPPLSTMASPEEGIQEFLWGSSNVNRDLKLAKDAGFKWVKQMFQWNHIEKEGKGKFEWNEPDRLVGAAEKNEVKMLARVDFSPMWARPKGADPKLDGPPADYNDFGDFLTALAVAYQVQCRLCDVAPVRARGFDHTTQGAYAVAAGVSKALGLDQDKTANATAFNALRVNRTGALSHWKGLAYPNTAFGATHTAFLAMRGITGPREVFEGNKGFMDAIAGPFTIDWPREGLERVTRTILKKFNAEIHSQSTLEAVLELKRESGFAAAEVARIEIEIFDVAYHIIGGGEEGDKTVVQTKEEADHSLPYLVAVALLDDQVMPEQYEPARIQAPDVQALLRKVSVRPAEGFSRRFPDEMPCRLSVTLRDGRVLVQEPKDYEGFHTRPMRWDTVVQKFERLSSAHAEASLRREIIGAVANLETIQVLDLARLLAQVRAAAG